jgi:hypothetical protein
MVIYLVFRTNIFSPEPSFHSTENAVTSRLRYALNGPNVLLRDAEA